MRRSAAFPALALASLACAAAIAACSVDLGELPARCDDATTQDACPEGYDCIHGVCAAPGTAIPLTVTRLQYLRSYDLRMVPLQSGVLLAWQIYDYDNELHRFVGVRVRSDGEISPVMTLVDQYPANANYLEPYFDLIATSDTELLLSVGAAPADESPDPRLSQFAVHLPPAGKEGQGATSEKVWELSMRTLGYGGVSQPKLVPAGDGVLLAYFESRVDAGETSGDLAVFQLALDGTRQGVPTDCSDNTCCQANQCIEARTGAQVAVSVVDALVSDNAVWWVVDDTRPSLIRLANGPNQPVQADLPRLSIPVQVGGSEVTLLEPSQRAGEGLPDDPVKGAAELRTLTPPSEKTNLIGSMPVIRDTPRPAWIPRAGKDALLLTPGADVDAGTIAVYRVDATTAQTSKLAEIERYSTIPIAAVRALVQDGRLYVAWLDASEDAATIRVEVRAEP